MFKSPARTPPPKRAPISFVKTVTSPQHARAMQVQTAKSISTVENDFAIEQFNKPTTHLLSLEITLDRPVRTLRLAFPYHPETAVEELIDFIRREVREDFLYFKTKNLNV